MLDISDQLSRILDDTYNPEEPVGLAILIGILIKLRLLFTIRLGLPVPKSARYHGKIYLYVLNARATKPVIPGDSDIPVHGRFSTSSTTYRCLEIICHRFSDDTSYPPNAT